MYDRSTGIATVWRLEQRFAESDAKWERRLAELRGELIKWMFLFWTGTALANLLLR